MKSNLIKKVTGFIVLFILIFSICINFNTERAIAQNNDVSISSALVSNGGTLTITIPANAIRVVAAKIRWTGYTATVPENHTITSTYSGTFGESSAYFNGNFPAVPQGGTLVAKTNSVSASWSPGANYTFTLRHYGFNTSEGSTGWWLIESANWGPGTSLNRSWSAQSWCPDPSKFEFFLSASGASGSCNFYANTNYSINVTKNSESARVTCNGSTTYSPNNNLPSGTTTAWTDIAGFGVGTNNLTFNVSGSNSVYYEIMYTYETNDIPLITLATNFSQPFTEEPGHNNIALTGTVKDTNIGDIVNVKYTIVGLAGFSSIVIGTITADGTNQAYTGNIPIDTAIPEGTYSISLWAEDNHGGVSANMNQQFVVDKSGISTSPAIRVATTENKAFDIKLANGSFTDVSADFMQNNSGNGKPFLNRVYTCSLYGVDSNFYDFGSTMTYIGNDLIRVVTSEGKAFNVTKSTGAFQEVTETFLHNNFGPGKPFYHREYNQKINGFGPIPFHDFGSSMAYIGNNKIRVVTSEGKAFDVDKDTGAYTEVTASFISSNNFGPGKPFFLRTFTHTIGGETKTFYDWGSSMAYIGNNTLRVVTSEGKAFDVDVNDGHIISDVTSTFLVNNFGVGKPFYHRTYNVTINGTSYQFHDWGCAFAYIQDNNPNLTITSPQAEAAFDTITLTGTVSDKNNNNVEITATINGVSPPQTYTATNTATPQTWTLTWNTGSGGVADGKYSDIEVTARDIVTNEITTAIYTGSIYVFGADSGYTRKTVVYEYDDNGKMVRKRLANNP